MTSIPPPELQQPQEPPDERRMSIAEATLWTIGAVVAFGSLAQIVRLFVPDLEHDQVSLRLCQVVAYLTLLVLLQLVYFPRTRVGVVFAARRTSWAFYPVAALLGVVINLPVNGLYEAILARWPDTAQAVETLRGFSTLPLWRQIAGGVGLVVATPLVEEAFFRGALFGTLRRHYGPVVVATCTALMFAFIHIQPQAFLPIALVGGALAFLRIASGSFWPGLLMHMTFNGVTLYAMLQGPGADNLESQEPMPAWLMVAGTVITGGLLALTDYLRTRRLAAEATKTQEPA